MKQLNQRIQELQKEADQLVNRRETALNSVKEMEARIHQLVGAIQELSKLAQTEEGAENESSTSN